MESSQSNIPIDDIAGKGFGNVTGSEAYSVSKINQYIRNMFQTDFLLRNVRVTGEVSNCKYHSSGHIYFTLKDEASALACVMYAGDRAGMKFTLDDEMKIIASGRISVYERDGKYQLYVKSVQRDGARRSLRRWECSMPHIKSLFRSMPSISVSSLHRPVR